MHESEHSAENWLPDDLMRFEERLAALTADSPRIDRDQLMFAAGRASATGGIGRWAWPLATAVSSAAAAVLAVMLVGLPPAPNEVAPVRPTELAQVAEAPSEPERVTARPVPLARARPVTLLGRGYLGERQWALADGVDALGRQRGARADAGSKASSPPVTVRELLQEMTENS